MKKIGLFLGFLFLSGLSHAAYIESYSLGTASFTTTNDAQVQISTHGGILVGVVIDSPSNGGLLTLADAKIAITGGPVTYSTFSILSLGGTGFQTVPVYIPYGIYLSSGLTYTTSGNAGGVTIIWKPFMNPSSGR